MILYDTFISGNRVVGYAVIFSSLFSQYGKWPIFAVNCVIFNLSGTLMWVTKRGEKARNR